MKTKSFLLVAAVTLGAFLLPGTSAEAGRKDYRHVKKGDRVVVVYAPASRRSYYNAPIRYKRPYYNPGPGVSVRVNVR